MTGSYSPRYIPSRPGSASDRLLTAVEVAEILQVRVDYVYALCRRNAIPHIRLGERKLRFRRQAIYDWLAETERRFHQVGG